MFYLDFGGGDYRLVQRVQFYENLRSVWLYTGPKQFVIFEGPDYYRVQHAWQKALAKWTVTVLPAGRARHVANTAA